MADPTNIAVFSLMKSRMQMLSERQKVLAENVANISTPGFVPKDVDQDAFANVLSQVAGSQNGPGQVGATRMALTNSGHIDPPGRSGANVALKSTPDSETTLDGNAVVAEEQMMKIAETRMDFETMVGLYQKSLGLLRLASRSPTR